MVADVRRSAAAELATWAPWLVEQYELWARIPPCWAEHPSVVAELTVLHDYREAVDATDAAPLSAAQLQAAWHDYFGRTLDRIKATPAADCAISGVHRSPRTWDKELSGDRRRAERQAARAAQS